MKSETMQSIFLTIRGQKEKQKENKKQQQKDKAFHPIVDKNLSEENTRDRVVVSKAWRSFFCFGLKRKNRPHVLFFKIFTSLLKSICPFCTLITICSMKEIFCRKGG
jgi:hypothetical protein